MSSENKSVQLFVSSKTVLKTKSTLSWEVLQYRMMTVSHFPWWFWFPCPLPSSTVLVWVQVSLTLAIASFPRLPSAPSWRP